MRFELYWAILKNRRLKFDSKASKSNRPYFSTSPKRAMPISLESWEAADIHVENTEHLLKIMHFIMDETDFDQLIWEKNKQGTQWVHVSYRRNGVNKHQVLSSRELLFTTKIK